MSNSVEPEVANPVDKIMLDDYGNPIGQLVVNMGNNTSPVSVSDTFMEDAGTAAAEDTAAELPGIDPGEISIYYPSYDDDEKRNKAKALFLNKGMEVSAISKMVEVPERTILMWVANNHWAEARRREIVAKDELSRLDLAETRIKRRNSVFHEQLEQAEKIRRKALEGIENESISVKSGAEAWTAAAKTEQTILGLSEAGKVASADGKEVDDGKKDGKERVPLVCVFQGGGLAPIRRDR